MVLALAWLWGRFNPKVRRTLRLRAWKAHLSLRFRAGTTMEYWIHVASVGELEYAIPLIEELQRRGKGVLVSYYSISAKTRVEALPEQYRNICLVVPLPHDGLGLMKDFVHLLHQQGVRTLLLMKYELWPGMLWECQARRIRVVLVNAIRPGAFHRRLIHKIYAIYMGYASEAVGLHHPRISIIGDTRVDRVLERVGGAAGVLEQKLGHAAVEMKAQPLFVIGSLWPTDYDVLRATLQETVVMRKNWGIAVVPHEIDSGLDLKVAHDLLRMGYAVTYMDAAGSRVFPTEDTARYQGPRAWVVNRTGILAELYSLAVCAYVGGGFNENVHSVWEPALSGAWTACGPKRGKSPESFELEAAGALTVLQDSTQAWGWLEQRMAQGRASTLFTDGLSRRHRGAAKKVIEKLEVGDEFKRVTSGAATVASRTT